MSGTGTWMIAVLTGCAAAAAHLTHCYYRLFLSMTALPLWLAEFWCRGSRR